MAASSAPADAKSSCASPSRPMRDPRSSPAAWAIATAVSARSHAAPSERGQPSAARSAAGTPIATSASGTSAGGTLGRALAPCDHTKRCGQREKGERAGGARLLRAHVAERQPDETRERVERDEEEVREETALCEEQRDERERDAELRARVARAPRDDEAEGHRDGLHTHIGQRSKEWQTAVGPEEDETGAAREHRLADRGEHAREPVRGMPDR